MRQSTCRLKFEHGVQLWVEITTRRVYDRIWMGKAVSLWERNDRRRLDTLSGIVPQKISDFVSFVVPPVWGFDLWYRDSPVVVAYMSKSKRVTIGVKSRDIAHRLFGSDGLLSILPHLGKGWGGRDTVLGSPSGEKISVYDAEGVAELVAKQVEERHVASVLV